METIADLIRWMSAMLPLSLLFAAVFVAFGIAKFARFEQVAVEALVSNNQSCDLAKS